MKITGVQLCHFPLPETFQPSWLPGFPMATNGTNGIGLLANLQVMGGVSNVEWCEYPIDPPGWPIEARDAMLVEPVEVGEKGQVMLPDAPGLGITLDEERVAAHSEEV